MINPNLRKLSIRQAPSLILAENEIWEKLYKKKPQVLDNLQFVNIFYYRKHKGVFGWMENIFHEKWFYMKIIFHKKTQF